MPVSERDSDHLRVTLYKCGECRGTSSDQAWGDAWWSERSRRSIDPEWTDDDYGPDHGLDERMVCPRCKHVHADDDSSWVDEVQGTALIVNAS